MAQYIISSLTIVPSSAYVQTPVNVMKDAKSQITIFIPPDPTMASVRAGLTKTPPPTI
jgi:hypothetical protein